MVEILGVGFDVERNSSGAFSIQVVSIPPNSLAIEFIVEVNKAWASQVMAVKPDSVVTVPASANAQTAQIRLFDKLGKELTKGTLFEICLKTGARTSHLEQVTSRFASQKLLFILFAVIVSGYLVLYLPDFLKRRNETSNLAISSTPTLAVLSRSANLRSQPLLLKENVLTILPFGTQLFEIGNSGEFVEVQVFGGQKGFVHKNIVGDATKVRILGGQNSLDQAKTCPDKLRGAMMSLATRLKPYILDVSMFSDTAPKNLDVAIQDAIWKSSGDDVTGRFFHYLAEEAAVRKHFSEAITYFRAASFVYPTSIDDVHGWGITQLKQAGEVDESAMLHAVIIAPKAANTWVMVAGHLSRSNDDFAIDRTVKALRLALEFSKDRTTTRRFLIELRRSPVSGVFKDAITLALK